MVSSVELRELRELIISAGCGLDHIASVKSAQCGSRLSAWGLTSNKKDLIASNDKADAQVPDAIIKSFVINQIRV